MIDVTVPFGLTDSQFTTRFRGFLNAHSARLIEEIKRLIARSVPDTVSRVDIEIFLDEYGETGPSIGVYFQGPNNKVDHSDESIFAGRHISLGEGLKSIEQFDEKYFNCEERVGLSLQGNALKSWFAECWWKAGGWEYGVKTSVSIHDCYGDGDAIELASGI